MTWAALRATLAAGPVAVTWDGVRLCVRGDRAVLTAALQRAIGVHREGLVMWVTGRLRSGSGLYRYVRRGDRVRVPGGAGTVVQVFGERVLVLCDGAMQGAFYVPEVVGWPVGR